MLFHLLFPLREVAAFNVFRYITFRSIVAFLIAALVSVVWGRHFIRRVRRLQFGQVVRGDGPASHLKKAGTPTMGGVFIVGSLLAAIAVCGNFLSAPLGAALSVTLLFFVLGAVDDCLKVSRGSPAGLRPRTKLFWQFLVAGAASVLLVRSGVVGTGVHVPFLKEPLLDAGWWYAPFAALVVVGSSNAANLTDGLDGLAIGPIITSAAALSVLAYVAGHSEIAGYLYIPYVEGVGELTVLGAALLGAGVGFLWYNSHPAEIFMGDAGSLSLGAALGMMAVLTKNELLFVVIGGVLVMEALSVIIQVLWFKASGRRVFRMAPIHHHFELMGWPESKVIVRFWIISICLALMSLATLKTR